MWKEWMRGSSGKTIKWEARSGLLLLQVPPCGTFEGTAFSSRQRKKSLYNDDWYIWTTTSSLHVQNGGCVRGERGNGNLKQTEGNSKGKGIVQAKLKSHPLGGSYDVLEFRRWI